MADLPSLTLDPRTVGRKSALRRLRNEGKVPGSLYGYGDATSVVVDRRALLSILRSHGPGTLMNVNLDGEKSFGVLKDVDRNAVTDQLLHVSIQKVALDEQINTTTALRILGDADREDDDGILSVPLAELSIRCRADAIPEFIEVDVSGLTIGHGLRVIDLVLPDDVEFTNNPEQVIATVSIVHIVEEDEEEEGLELLEGEELPEGEEAAEGEEATEGEGR